MKIKVKVIVAFSLLWLSAGSINAQQIIWDISIMEKAKSSINTSDQYGVAIQTIIEHADSVLRLKDYPRVTRKDLTIASSDIRDYVSQATYYWRNSNSEDGLPYSHKDGHANPEVSRIPDYNNLVRVSTRLQILGLAYYFTEDEQYAQRAVSYLYYWFLSKEDGMNPNFNHAQMIPGVNKGRIEGIIEARFLTYALDAIQIFKGSESLSPDRYNGLIKWFEDFLFWMENSEIGKQGLGLKNNIGTAYQMQRMAFSRFIGKEAEVSRIKNNDLNRLLTIQFEADGAQPLELRRKSSANYSIANLGYWLKIEQILKNQALETGALSNSSIDQIKSGVNYLKANNLKANGATHRRIYNQLAVERVKPSFFNRLFGKEVASFDAKDLNDAICIVTTVKR